MGFVLSKGDKAMVRDGFSFYVVESGDLEGFVNAIARTENAAMDSQQDAIRLWEMGASYKVEARRASYLTACADYARVLVMNWRVNASKVS